MTFSTVLEGKTWTFTQGQPKTSYCLTPYSLPKCCLCMFAPYLHQQFPPSSDNLRKCPLQRQMAALGEWFSLFKWHQVKMAILPLVTTLTHSVSQRHNCVLPVAPGSQNVGKCYPVALVSMNGKEWDTFRWQSVPAGGVLSYLLRPQWLITWAFNKAFMPLKCKLD